MFVVIIIFVILLLYSYIGNLTEINNENNKFTFRNSDIRNNEQKEIMEDINIFKRTDVEKERIIIVATDLFTTWLDSVATSHIVNPSADVKIHNKQNKEYHEFGNHVGI